MAKARQNLTKRYRQLARKVRDARRVTGATLDDSARASRLAARMDQTQRSMRGIAAPLTAELPCAPAGIVEEVSE